VDQYKNSGVILNSPPLQGRGKGWGLSKTRLGVLQTYAKEMRRLPTEMEKALWKKLQNSQLGGYKFRRQAVVGNYIADFLCAQKALVVEIDGETHVQIKDDKRDSALGELGFQVLRVTNKDVVHNIDGVMEIVLHALRQAPDRWPRKDSPHPNPSPEGEGLRIETENA
jgi:very-short-patch-repair endonuclease